MHFGEGKTRLEESSEVSYRYTLLVRQWRPTVEKLHSILAEGYRKSD